jgi:F-type H+-transporting ATPase subunit epsilon
VEGAGRLTLTVVTPERAVLPDALCDEVTLPAQKGEIGILPGHTPLIALLGIGVVAFRDGSRRATLAVRGGFVEISGDVVRILADEAEAPGNVDPVRATAEKKDAESRRDHASGDEELDAANADVRFADARLAVAGPA